MKQAVKLKVRCAIYTRKSSEEGLDMEYNSLHAQFDACSAFIKSQVSQGWVQLPTRYDDGGFSGGTLDRPAIKRLISDIEQGIVDRIIVYKTDRLCRSVRDSSKLLDILERNHAGFTSVTELHNTTTATGRLNLNIQMSVGQYEREQTGERIRDKILASRQRGIFMGGPLPLGYFVKHRKLHVRDDEANAVRMVFERFVSLGSATKLAQQLAAEGVLTRSGKKFDKGVIYKILNNRVYIGLAVHKGEAYPGEHEGIIALSVWDKVHTILKTNSRERAAHTRRRTPALLKGLIFGPDGAAMSPTHTRRRGRLYRYYVSQTVLKGGANDCPVQRVPAGEIEAAIIDQMRVLLLSPELLAGVSRAVRETSSELTESDVREAIKVLDHLWDELFPAEQARVFQLLISRVDVDAEGITIQFRGEGLAKLVDEIRQEPSAEEAA